MDQDALKKLCAEAALAFVEDDMMVGVGTGSTVNHFIAALAAKRDWETLSWVERASITLKAAELLSKRHRELINAATMLGQGKSVYQAEIDAAPVAITTARVVSCRSA